MSAMMGCANGLAMTGMVFPDIRTDAYTLVTDAMNKKVDISVSRADAKSATMKHLYGSMAVPKAIFGDKVEYFFETLREEAPGAMKLFDLLKNSWDPELINNTWELPDFHMAHVPVTETIETRIHVPAIKYTPSVIVEVVKPQDYGVSLIANAVHSVDAYVLRTMVRRCNYSPRKLKEALATLRCGISTFTPNSKYIDKYNDTNLVDLTMVNDVPRWELLGYPQDMRDALIRIIEMSLSHKPFDIITIHDSFACLVGNLNQLRRTYADIMAELVRSTVVDDILSQITQTEVKVDRYNSNLEELAYVVSQSNYGVS